jgi:hypothetical protein
MDHDIGTFFAAPKAQVGFYLYVQRSGGYFVSQLIHDFFGSSKLAIDVLAYEADLFHWKESPFTAYLSFGALTMVSASKSRLSSTLTYLVFPRKFVL